MRTIATICIALVLAFILGAGQLAPAGNPAKETAKPALVEFLGADGKITNREFHRINDSDAWLALWAKHTGVEKDQLNWSGSYPKIDFTRCMVIAFFRGKTVNTRGEELQAVDEVDGKLRLRFCTSSYQTMSLKGEDHGVDAVSFGIWIVPKNSKPIIIEENVQDLIGKPPVWKEQATFDALKN